LSRQSITQYPHLKVLSKKGYSFSFYNNEHEPIHVHVKKDGCEAVVEIEPIRVKRNIGFSDKDLQRIIDIIKEKKEAIKGAWYDFFAA
jgi:hypothetical protein